MFNYFRLKYFFGSHGIVFDANGLYFDRMFKMILNLTECLKWSSFSQSFSQLVFFLFFFLWHRLNH